MSAIQFGRGREYQFFRQEDVRRRWDLHSAVQFLNGFRTDAAALASFRREVAKEAMASPAVLTDDQVIQSLARMLVSGVFLVTLPQRQQYKDPLELRAPVEATPRPRSSSPAEVVEDEPTFESDHDGVAQAAVLIAAARAAFPFCEECAKHPAQQAAGIPVARPPASAPAVKQAASQPIPKKETSAPATKQTIKTQPVEKETYWVEISLIGEDGQPIPGEEYIVELPDGKRETGFLDGSGLARFSDLLTSGNCKVSFPQLDRDAWQLVPQKRN